MKIQELKNKINFVFFCRQITADDVAVLQLQLVGGTFVMVTINSQVQIEQKLSSYSAGEPFFLFTTTSGLNTKMY